MKYYWSYDCSNWSKDFENTIFDCIKVARQQNVNNEKYVYIGLIKAVVPQIDVDEVLDIVEIKMMMEADMDDPCWDLGDFSDFDLAELEHELNAVFFKWLRRTGRVPDVACLENIEKYDLEKGVYIRE